MDEMKYPIAYADLCASLGYYGSPIPDELKANLQNKLEMAAIELQQDHKITVNSDDLFDNQLLSMYAEWLYKGRASGSDKPPMLAAELRNAAVRRAKTKPEATA